MIDRRVLEYIDKVEKENKKLKKQKSDKYIVVIVFLSALCAVLIWAVRWFQNASIRMEEQNDILLQRIWDLQEIDKQKCIDLLLNDEI